MEAEHHHGSSEESEKVEGGRGGREGGSRSECERDLERRTESQETGKKRDVVCQAPLLAPEAVCVPVVVVWGSR